MFAIYKNGSVGFRSSADNLYEVKKTDAPNKVYLKPDDDSMFEQLITSKKDEEKSKARTANSEAINKYKKMANIDTSSKIYHVEDIMNKNLIAIDVNDTIKDAYDVLRENGISQIPILNEDKKITGLINKKFILNLIVDNIEVPTEILGRRLDDVFFPEVITTDPITDIRRVAKVMIDLKIDAIPVVDENERLLGMVSKTDIIKAVSNIPHLQLWS